MKNTSFKHLSLLRALLVCAAFAVLPASAQEMPAAPVSAEPMSSEPPPTGPAPTGPAPPRAPGVPDPAPVHPELVGVFEDFGGMPGMLALMDDFMSIMLQNPQLRPFFENTEQDRIKRQLAEQFCAILGGGCIYSGRDMQESHVGFEIRRADFNALVEDLQVAMNRKGIPFRSQNKLLAILAPMHREVITR